MRVLPFIFAFIGASTLISRAAGLEEARRLEDFGLYSLAEELYAASNEPEAVDGLLRVLLAQKKPEGVLETLQKQTLPPERQALYRLLAATQLNATLEAQKWATVVELEKLQGEEADWARMALGMRDYLAGSLDAATAKWQGITQSTEALEYAMNLQPKLASMGENPLSKKASKELAKRIKRLKADDWGVFKFYILGTAKSSGVKAAVEMLRPRADRFAPGEPQLLMAYLLPKNSPERRDWLLEVLKNPKVADATRLVGLKMATEEENIALIELAEIIKTVSPRLAAKMEVVLAVAWAQRGEGVKALRLLEKTKVDALSCDFMAVYYSQLAALAEVSEATQDQKLAPLAYKSLTTLDCLAEAEKNIARTKLADSYFKNSQFAEAGEVYASYADSGDSSERSRGLYQATIAYLKAKEPQKAEEILKLHFGSWPQAFLAYLMDGKGRGLAVEELMAPFENRAMSDSERWPIEYLRVKELEEKNPALALEQVERILAEGENASDWKVNFELEKFDLLKRLGELDRAQKLLTEKLIMVAPHSGFVRRGIEEALNSHRYAEALSILERLTDAEAEEKAYLLLLALEGISQKEKVEEYSNRLITLIDEAPAGFRTDLALKLARLWAKVGMLERAVNLCDSLLERDMDEATRAETEFLKCSLLEMEGKPEAETGLTALSQRPNRATALAAYARLVEYYIANNRPEEAKTIFNRELARIISGTEAMPASAQSDVLSAAAAMIKILPQREAASLSDWMGSFQKLETM